MDTVEGVYKALEQHLEDYLHRRTEQIFSPHKTYSVEELYKEVGKAQAARELQITFRNLFGYEPGSL